MIKRKRIYFDYAATTPVAPAVLAQMQKYFAVEFGNPSSLHRLGQAALKAVDFSREKIKLLIEANSVQEIIFTSSATESNNLIIKGVALDYYFRYRRPSHLVSSQIDHPSVTEILKDLEKLTLAEVTLIAPEKSGLISPTVVLASIKPNTALISIHYVNSEIGVIQPIAEIASKLKEINARRAAVSDLPKVIFHTDAAQAPLTENISIKELGVEAMTLSAHKIYGPKGIACLYKKESIALLRLLSGSEQEFNWRPGTENVPGIVGLAAALESAVRKRLETKNHLFKIKKYFARKLEAAKINFKLNPSVSNWNYDLATSFQSTSPKIVNLYLPEAEAQDLLVYLDQKGIAVSPGLACKARALIPSPVIEALYPHSDRSSRSLRFSFGRETLEAEIDYLVAELKKFLAKK